MDRNDANSNQWKVALLCPYLLDGGRVFKPTARKDLSKVSIRAIRACHCFRTVALDDDAMGLRPSMLILRRCELSLAVLQLIM